MDMQAVDRKFAEVFCDRKPVAPEPFRDPEGDRQARERYIAERTPELLREYQTPAKWCEAAHEALLAPHGDFWHALIAGKTADAGLMIRAIVMTELTAMAKDAAEDEAYRLLPEVES